MSFANSVCLSLCCFGFVRSNGTLLSNNSILFTVSNTYIFQFYSNKTPPSRLIIPFYRDKRDGNTCTFP